MVVNELEVLGRTPWASIATTSCFLGDGVHPTTTVRSHELAVDEPAELYHLTIGRDVGEVFDSAEAPDGSLDVRNLLVVDRDVPAEATSGLQGTALEFVDQNTYEPRITASFIDQGEMLPAVAADIRGGATGRGRLRPSGVRIL